MEEYYLICSRCNGYYELEAGESPQDFYSCQCGGELILVTDLEYLSNVDYDKYGGYEYGNSPKKRTYLKKSSLLVVTLIILIPVFLFLNSSWLGITASDTSMMQKHSLLGTDNRGYVLKDVYASSNSINSKSKTIAIVTGIHPREGLSKNVTTDLIRKYPLNSNIRIVHYDIKVTDNPDNYNTGRNNGEGLAADYILPDVLKSKDNLVIICHDHKPGYGKGFYVATPQMDEKSKKIAELVNQTVPGFNYFRSDNTKESTTSAARVSKPLASAGYPTLVYEIPEWISYSEAYSTTRSLIESCFNYI